MSEIEEEPRIIKLSEVKPEFRKKYEDKIFRFECDIIDDQLRLGLREINSYSPYYYENYYTFEEIQKIKNIFRAMNGLEDVKDNLIKVFRKEKTILNNLENDTKIEIIFPLNFVEGVVKAPFILERKTIENKEKGLLYLYKIQKDKIKLMEKISSICKDEDYQNEKAAKDILNILDFSD